MDGWSVESLLNGVVAILLTRGTIQDRSLGRRQNRTGGR